MNTQQDIETAHVAEARTLSRRIRLDPRARDIFHFDRLAAALGMLERSGREHESNSRSADRGTYRREIPDRAETSAEDFLEALPLRGDPQVLFDGATILLVDDEPEVLSMAEAALEMRGYKVVSKANGLDAADHYRRHWRSIDLVLTDVVMPVMDGRDLLGEIRRVNSRAVVIMMSGYCSDETAEALLQEGAHSFLDKPYTLDQLWDAIENGLHCSERAI